MKRTSNTQFDMMVTFMEQHGDLNKPSANARGRAQTYQNWAELCTLLNSDASGGEKTEEQWKKVWRDLKSNTKKKSARIHRAATGTGGGPPLSCKLTDLELRVLRIIGPEAATGFNEVIEAGFSQELVAHAPTAPTPIDSQINSNIGEHSLALELIETEEHDASRIATDTSIPLADVEISMAEWDVPGTSHAELPASTPTPRPAPAGQTTPRRRRLVPGRNRRSPQRRRLRPTTALDRAEQAFQQSDEEWRNFLTEHHRKEQENEEKRLQLRATELRVQEQWQEIARKALELIEKKF